MSEPNQTGMVDPTQAGVSVALAERAPRVHLFRRIAARPIGLVSMIILAIVILTAIFAPLLASADPNSASIGDVLGPAAPGHPLGFDSSGRDVFSRLLYAGRFSLAGALLALIISLSVGTLAGLFAGYYGKWFDSVSTWLAGMLMALPAIMVLLAARAAVGPSMWISMAVFGVIIAPSFFRLTYTLVRGVREELYVDAARVSGLSDGRIITRHILTVVRAPIIIQSAIILGVAIAVQAGLEFLGLGDTTIPTWGNMLNDGFANIYTNVSLVVWPTLVIALVCICLTLLANVMRDVLERSGGKTRKRRKPTTERIDPDKVPPIVHPADERSGERLGEMLLEVTDLAVGYDQPDGSVKEVVHDVSLTVRRGEVHGLIGESGSGKTQTAWSVMQLLPQGGHVTGGSVMFEGAELAHASEKDMLKIRGRKIAYIPQEPMSNLDPSFTIGYQLVEPMRVCLGISKKEATERALALLARVGIPNPQRTFDAYPHEVSGGMAQRVLIAGSVSCEPDLLIADEPTTALDVTVQAEVLDLLRSLQAELNMGVILVTHNFGVVADICDRVSVMRGGRVVETGPVRSIFYHPEHEYTQKLLGDILQEEEPRGPLVAAGANPTTTAKTVNPAKTAKTQGAQA